MNERVAGIEEKVQKELSLVNKEIASVNKKISSVNKKIAPVSEEIDNVKVSVSDEIAEINEKFEKDIQNLEKRFLEPNASMPIINPVSAQPFRPAIKVSPYDGKTSWNVCKTQFEMVTQANQWDSQTKAFNLAASLRGEAADILQTLPAEKRTDADALTL